VHVRVRFGTGISVTSYSNRLSIQLHTYTGSLTSETLSTCVYQTQTLSPMYI